nr:MAG TPA: receptor binding protein [Caudoviricetes sp.]
MASIKDVYRGMQNGAETINDNLEAINAELASGGNVVHKTGDESIAGNKTFTGDTTVKNLNITGNIKTTTTVNVNVGAGMNIKLTKKGNFVEVRFYGAMTTIKNGAEMGGAGSAWISPDFRPEVTVSLVGHFASSTESFHIDIEPTGRVVWWGAEVIGTGGLPRGTAFYFLN